MSDYTKIADTGNGILSLLKEALIPEFLNSPDQIGLCPPEDHGDFAVGVWLYDIREDNTIQAHEMTNIGRNTQRYPSVYLRLYYMITLYLQSDLKYRAVQEHQMFGRIIQTLRDHAALDPDSFLPAEGSGGANIRIQMQDLEMEEKVRLWTVPNAAYRTSLFYNAGPVEIQSVRKKSVKRVMEINYRFAGKET
ncbi:MAG: DUF4255 domain-containing protein [Lachnospiraceae bacterium]|jgi:hypothetical protein|nr:DUF4255 domain-containing protein [Lachnospiraceae bacterium]